MATATVAFPGQAHLFPEAMEQVDLDAQATPKAVRLEVFTTWLWKAKQCVRFYGSVEVVFSRDDRGLGGRRFANAVAAAEFAASVAGAGYSVGIVGG